MSRTDTHGTQQHISNLERDEARIAVPRTVEMHGRELAVAHRGRRRPAWRIDPARLGGEPRRARVDDEDLPLCCGVCPVNIEAPDPRITPTRGFAACEK